MKLLTIPRALCTARLIPVFFIATLMTNFSGAADNPEEAPIRKIIEDQASAWNAGDGEAYGARFADGGSFTNIFGMVMYGKPEFITRHSKILSTFYRKTSKRHNVGRIRFITPDVAIVDIDNEVHGVTTMPVGIPVPRDGVLRTQLMEVFVKRGGEWFIEVYHNVDLKTADKR